VAAFGDDRRVQFMTGKSIFYQGTATLSRYIASTVRSIGISARTYDLLTGSPFQIMIVINMMPVIQYERRPNMIRLAPSAKPGAPAQRAPLLRVLHPTAMPEAGAPHPAMCVRLRDGALVELRDAIDSDQFRLRKMFFTLSDTTRYLYFCAGVPANEAWAERVAALGVAHGSGSYTMVAVADGGVVGVARFDRNGRGRELGRELGRDLGREAQAHEDDSGELAEIGILLTDAWQSRGLGREVLTRLHAEALRRRLGGFTATVLGENRRALRLLRRAYPHLHASLAYGQYELAMPFDLSTTPER
jgi:acetyltransferase